VKTGLIKMKLIHTSDWHLGRNLHGKKRYKEFESFLNWMIECLDKEKCDVLLIAGDIFDTTMPTHLAQKLYYSFLVSVSQTACTHVVIIAGNHDSPTFLNAPRELLNALNIHVVAEITDTFEDEVILLRDETGNPLCIICAVPFLRDRDLRTVESGEDENTRVEKFQNGIARHYEKVCDLAEQKRNNSGLDIPIIATGHLFTQGGSTKTDDGVRDLYVGTIGHINPSIFPDTIDYLALGHLHIPQLVGKNKTRRYCGSPIPMGFGEASQKKIVVAIEFNTKKIITTEINVPCFQELKRISGTLDEIFYDMEKLKKEKSTAWLEVTYKGKKVVPNLNEMIEEFIERTNMELLIVKNQQKYDSLKLESEENITLAELDEYAIFDAFLDSTEIDTSEKDLLRKVYKEAVTGLSELDTQAE
jgi:exonuclease SbcD